MIVNSILNALPTLAIFTVNMRYKIVHIVKDIWGFLQYLIEKRRATAAKNNFPRWF